MKLSLQIGIVIILILSYATDIFSQVNLNVTMTDSIIGSGASDGNADRGDTIRLKVIIQNTGSDAMNVSYSSTPDTNYPVCITGKRACPPEDCGGSWGYAELLEIISDSSHPEYEERMEWLGKNFNQDTFDINEVKQRLREFQ